MKGPAARRAKGRVLRRESFDVIDVSGDQLQLSSAKIGLKMKLFGLQPTGDGLQPKMKSFGVCQVPKFGNLASQTGSDTQNRQHRHRDVSFSSTAGNRLSG